MLYFVCFIVFSSNYWIQGTRHLEKEEEEEEAITELMMKARKEKCGAKKNASRCENGRVRACKNVFKQKSSLWFLMR